MVLLSYLIFFLFGLIKGNNDTYGTLSPTIESSLKLFLPSEYNLPKNYYEWNVTEMVILINQTNPGLLENMPTEYLVTIFPDVFLQQLPRSLLIVHELYCLLDVTDPYYAYNNSNCSQAIVFESFCGEPFTDTKFLTYFEFPCPDCESGMLSCGLKCEHANILWGYNDNETNIINIVVLIFCVLFLVIIVIVGINNFMDIHFYHLRCCVRPFIFHATIILTVSYSIVAFTLFAPHIFSKDNIVCNDDINNQKTVSFRNPGNHFTKCAAMGTLFYFGTLLAGLYTMAFSFALWREFYSPLVSLWTKCKDYTMCCLCARIQVCLQPLCGNIIHKICCTDHNVLNLELRRTKSTASNTQNIRVKLNRITFGELCCSTKMIMHYLLFIITILFTIFLLKSSTIDSFDPIGICTMGGMDPDSVLSHGLIPFSIIAIVTSAFIPVALHLLTLSNEKLKTVTTDGRLIKLRNRLLAYFICMLFCWLLIVIVLWVTFLNGDELEKSSEERVICALLNGGNDTEQCLFGYKISVFWVIMMAAPLPPAALSSLFLTCHHKNMTRWTILFHCCLDCIICSKQRRDERILIRLRKADDDSSNKSSRNPSPMQKNQTLSQTQNEIDLDSKLSSNISNDMSHEHIPTQTELALKITQSATSKDQIVI